MILGVVIAICISIVVGINLIPMVMKSVQEVETEGELSGGLAGLADVMVYIFVAVILIGAVAWLAGFASEGRSTGEGTHISWMSILFIPFYIFRGWVGLSQKVDSLILGDKLTRLSKKSQIEKRFVRDDLGLIPTPINRCSPLMVIGEDKLYLDKRFKWYPIKMEELDGHRTYTVVGKDKGGDYEETYALIKDLETSKVLVKEVTNVGPN